MTTGRDGLESPLHLHDPTPELKFEALEGEFNRKTEALAVQPVYLTSAESVSRSLLNRQKKASGSNIGVELLGWMLRKSEFRIPHVGVKTQLWWHAWVVLATLRDCLQRIYPESVWG